MMRRAGGLAVVSLLAGLWPAGGTGRAEVVDALERVKPPEEGPVRRDPFRPPRASAAAASGETKTPLERYELGQLRLTAVIYDTREPRAVVEDDSGLGYIIRLGTRVGPNGGKVQGIERGRVTIREDYVDFYGEHRPTDVTLELKVAERGKRR